VFSFDNINRRRWTLIIYDLRGFNSWFLGVWERHTIVHVIEVVDRKKVVVFWLAVLSFERTKNIIKRKKAIAFFYRNYSLFSINYSLKKGCGKELDFKDKKVLVVGIARSGMAAAKALLKRGAQVTACDKKTAEEIGSGIDDLKHMGTTIYFGNYPPISKKKFDIIVVSPGVPLDIPPVKEAYEQGIPVIGEVELAYLLKPESVQMYAITGTNGKTTTTSLLQCILADDGRKSVSGGNIGVPLTTLVDNMDKGTISVEVSSFQLETVIDFRPHICGILNITPDHLDRHKTMESYINAKSRILFNQTNSDYAILNYEDEIIRKLATRCRSRVIFFSTDQILNEGAFIKNNKITIVIDNKITEICTVDKILLRGKHNLENILCAAVMAFIAGVKPDIIRKTLINFSGVRHRMEEVASINGILYINDSKATNPESVIKALESFDQPIILIAGGRNKGSDFSVLARTISKRVKALVLLGEAREEIKTAVIQTGFKNIHEVEDFASGVKKAGEQAARGDIVLLSPACASWDMFKSYERRGDYFCELVNSLGVKS